MDVDLHAREQPVGGSANRGVQSAGFVLLLAADWRVTAASANLQEFLGIDAEETLGRPVASFLSPDTVHLIRNRVALLRDEAIPERLTSRRLAPGGAAFDACVRSQDGSVLVEACPASDVGGIDLGATTRRMLARLPSRCSLEALAAAATRELRALTGFDTIQIYRIAEPEHQCVGAFVRSGSTGFPPTLSLRDTDSRWIADSQAAPVPIVAGGPKTVSPALLAHPPRELTEAIADAGARSAIVLPIELSDGRCWGYVAALHKEPRGLRLVRLGAAELFARMLGMRIEVEGLRLGEPV
jgi:light-regulated signal transduction histidine kinase (bacteriophytochrome)